MNINKPITAEWEEFEKALNTTPEQASKLKRFFMLGAFTSMRLLAEATEEKDGEMLWDAMWRDFYDDAGIRPHIKHIKNKLRNSGEKI